MNKIQTTIRSILIFAVSASLITLSVWIANKINPEEPVREIIKEVVKETVRPIVSCQKDFESFREVAQKKSVEIISEKAYLNASNGLIKDRSVTIKRKGGVSNVACGYLYIVAGVNNKPLKQEWTNVVIRPDAFGGHIVGEKALVNNDIDNATEMLFSLDEIYYRKSKNRNEQIKVADWVSLMNVTDKITFDSLYVNINSPSGFIEKIVIAYKCWNPETGEETEDCGLEIEN